MELCDDCGTFFNPNTSKNGCPTCQLRHNMKKIFQKFTDHLGFKFPERDNAKLFAEMEECGVEEGLVRERGYENCSTGLSCQKVGTIYCNKEYGCSTYQHHWPREFILTKCPECRRMTFDIKNADPSLNRCINSTCQWDGPRISEIAEPLPPEDLDCLKCRTSTCNACVVEDQTVSCYNCGTKTSELESINRKYEPQADGCNGCFHWRNWTRELKPPSHKRSVNEVIKRLIKTT